jgi:hypothetical protein
MPGVAQAPNIFRIGRISGHEDQLTNLLVWLVGAVPEVGAALISMGLREHVAASDVTAVSQVVIKGSRFDAVISGSGVRLIVESKLGSEYSDRQILKYLEWLSRHPSDGASGLMTLTRRNERWPTEDEEFARSHGIAAEAKRWADLHDVLEPLASREGEDTLAARLVHEFLEMLEAENLVPVRPLTTEDLGTRWADSWRAVRHYGEFFEACRDAIAEHMEATAFPNRWSNRGDWPYQRYALEDSTTVVVGLGNTDEFEKDLPAPTHTPILWIGVLAEHLANWEDVKKALHATRPSGWREGNDRSGHPTAWRYLAEVIQAPDFDDQREALARAAAEARTWISAATESRSPT